MKWAPVQVEGDLPGDIVDHESARCPTIITSGDGTESLLARCVPYLKLDLLARNLNDSGNNNKCLASWFVFGMLVTNAQMWKENKKKILLFSIQVSSFIYHKFKKSNQVQLNKSIFCKFGCLI